MPKFLERKLKSQYGAESSIPYKIMNKMGVMHGSEETKKGEEMEKKHREKMRHASGVKKDKKMTLANIAKAHMDEDDKV